MKSNNLPMTKNDKIDQLSHTRALSDEQLFTRVPSIFSTQAHNSRSQSFTAIPTIDVLHTLRKEGFEVFSAQQSGTRLRDKIAFTKHMLSLRHIDQRLHENDEVFEIVLINANDGTSCYRMIPGVFRMVCANGLMVGRSFGEVKVRHTGDALNTVIDAAYDVMKNAKKEYRRYIRPNPNNNKCFEALICLK